VAELTEAGKAYFRKAQEAFLASMTMKTQEEIKTDLGMSDGTKRPRLHAFLPLLTRPAMAAPGMQAAATCVSCGQPQYHRAHRVPPAQARPKISGFAVGARGTWTPRGITTVVTPVPKLGTVVAVDRAFDGVIASYSVQEDGVQDGVWSSLLPDQLRPAVKPPKFRTVEETAPHRVQMCA
jgi:hypothetical protein